MSGTGDGAVASAAAASVPKEHDGRPLKAMSLEANDVHDLNEHVECTLCLRLLCKPVTTTCGACPHTPRGSLS